MKYLNSILLNKLSPSPFPHDAAILGMSPLQQTGAHRCEIWSPTKSSPVDEKMPIFCSVSGPNKGSLHEHIRCLLTNVTLLRRILQSLHLTEGLCRTMLVWKLFPIVALATSVWGWPIGNVTDPEIAARQLQGEMFTGDATFFFPGLGACGIVNGPGDFIAAASHEMFDTFPGATPNPNDNPICGKSVTAMADGNTVTVTITDRCAGCDGLGDLDFTPTAFAVLAPTSVGRIHGMNWVFND